MSTFIYAKLEIDATGVPISIENCSKVGELFLRIKKELDLKDVPSRLISLHWNDHKLDLESDMSQLGMNGEEKVIVKISSVVAGTGLNDTNATASYEKSPFRQIQSRAEVETNEGVPPTRSIEREATMSELLRLLLFPVASSAGNLKSCAFLMIRSPVMSGKTGCSQLLAERVLRDVPSALVSRISANRMLSDESLGSYFQRKFAMSLEHFVMVLETPRILIVDEAQLLYNTLEGENERFWRVYVKNAMEGALPGLRIVVLAAYGSFDPLRKNPRNSTPVIVPESRIVGLVPRFSDGVTVPGLLLCRHEFDALIGQYSFLTTSKFCDIIWNKTEGHLGVITGLLRFLASRISNVHVADHNRRIQEHLYSNEAYDYLTSNCRGLPQLNDAFKLAASETNTKEAANALANRMINILDSVCRGMLVTRYSMHLSPESNVASEILQASGFLHYDNQALSFASPLHQAIYMHSTRTSLVTDVDSMTFDRLLEMTIMRLSTFNLQAAADSNADAHGTTPYVRERQLHFEVHRALTTILPPPTFISNEQIVVSTNAQGDKRVGYVDIRININGGWFFELLVNGNAGMEHAARFEQGGKYSTALNQSSKWALIDFRSTKERVLWANYYVHFDDSFTKATLRDVKQGRITEIDLSK